MFTQTSAPNFNCALFVHRSKKENLCARLWWDDPTDIAKNETETIFINWREIFISLSGRWDAWCVVWWHSLNSSPQGIRQPESRWFVWWGWGCCLPSGLGGGPDVFLKEFLDSWLRIDSIRSSKGVDCFRIAASLRADACNQGDLERGRNWLLFNIRSEQNTEHV